MIEGDDTWRSWERTPTKVVRRDAFLRLAGVEGLQERIRVLLSKYRAYAVQRLRRRAAEPTSINFRLGSKANADAVLPPANAFHPATSSLRAARWRRCPASPFTI